MTAELLDEHLFDVAAHDGFLLFFPVVLGKLFSIQPQFLLLFFALDTPLFFLLSATLVSRRLILRLECLPAGVFTTHMHDQVVDLVVELGPLAVSLLIVISFDQALDSPVWGFSRVVDVDVCKLLD